MTHYSHQEISDAQAAVAYHNATGGWKEIPLRNDDHSLFMRNDGVVVDQSHGDAVVVDNPQAHHHTAETTDPSVLPADNWHALDGFDWSGVTLAILIVIVGGYAAGFLFSVFGGLALCCIFYYGIAFWQWGLIGLLHSPAHFILIPLFRGVVTFYVLITLNLILTTPGRMWLHLTGRSQR